MNKKSITRNSLQDLHFAETYLEFVSRRSNPEARARAGILLANIKVLDISHPEWREELLDELDRLGVVRSVETMFPLPEVDSGELFKEFMRNALKKE